MKGLILFEGTQTIINGDYYDVTEVLKVTPSKRASRWWNSKETKEYVKCLIDSDVHFCTTDLFKSERGGVDGGKTVIHKRMIVNFARWLNPRFAIACDEFIMNEITKNQLKAEEYKMKACQLERFLDKEDIDDLY